MHHAHSFLLQGFGLGLRQPHYEQVLREPVHVDWFEVMSENFMDCHPGHLDYLGDLRARYPLILHGVALNIGGIDPLDDAYLANLKALTAVAKPAFISDHLCWTGAGGLNTHDLLPIPYTSEALAHITDRVKQVQDVLGVQLVLENPSTYTQFTVSQMPEWEFLARLTEATGCGLLLDVNNVYVSAFNHHYSPQAYIAALPQNSIRYIHLAGHRHLGTHIIDTHDDRVVDDVWDLYAHTISHLGPTPTMIEWDGAIPELEVLLSELAKARNIASGALQKAAS